MPDSPIFRGVGVALATLFTADRAVDYQATADHAVRLVEAGVVAVAVTGSTGETAALTDRERRDLWVAVREALPVGIPVIAGTGAGSAMQAASLTAQAAEAGVDAALVLSPLRSADPRPYYSEVAAAADDLPLLAYHFPGASPPGIDLAVLPSLPVRGTKDSRGSPDRMLREVEEYDGEVYVGSSALLVQGGAVGCDGAILAAANVDPENAVAAFAGDGKAQRAISRAHFGTREDFPRGLKHMMAERYATSATVRMG